MDSIAKFTRGLRKYGIPFDEWGELSGLTTVRIGGRARIIVRPRGVLELIRAYEEGRECGVKCFVLGGGSNVLPSSDGFNGAVISTKALSEIAVERTGGEHCFVRAYAGAGLPALSAYLKGNLLSGGEFLMKIPGTVGGGVLMNAGCCGRQMADIVEGVTVYTGGGIASFSAAECGFEYRSSRFRENEIVISALFRTKTATLESICAEEERVRQLRRGQPKGLNMGSVFKNGEISAGKLIDDCGLKGFKVGGAEISRMHANFIINDGSATSDDVVNLIKIIKSVVKERTGVLLREEIKYLGEFF